MRLPALLVFAAAAIGGCATNRYVSRCPPESSGRDAQCPTSPEDTPVLVRLYLVGDAGEKNERRDAVLAALRRDLHAFLQSHGARGGRARIIYLGDNVYEVGLRESSEDCKGDPGGYCARDVAQLTEQIEPAGPHAPAVFVAGNHDWGNMGGEAGLRRLENQARFVRARVADSIFFKPDAGCPGPATEDLWVVEPTGVKKRVIRLIYLDTQWMLLTPRVRPRRPADANCAAEPTQDRVYARLREVIDEAGPAPVLIASHHPLMTGSSHGGNKGPERIASLGGVIVQDIFARPYAEMIERFRNVLEDSETPVIWAAGHDHVLQVIQDSVKPRSIFHLVSGAGSKLNDVDSIPGTRLAAKRPGFMRVDVLENGYLDAAVVSPCHLEQRPEEPTCEDESAPTIFTTRLWPPEPDN